MKKTWLINYWCNLIRLITTWKTTSLLLLMVVAIETHAQESRMVTGTVTSAEDGAALVGVTVYVKNTNTGTVTDIKGYYTLQVSGNDTLVFSYIGFLSEQVAVGNRSQIDVTILPSIEGLQEVVVIGYGTQKKSDVTGAVSSANLEAFREAPNTNAIQSLQGTVPGLNIGQVNRAGATPEISIRGRTTLNGNQNVLIILDGIQFNGSLASINPDDIESIDILKDVSSTAVYGAQAANGVILITTKGGKRNQKPKVTLNSSYTSLSPTVDLRPMHRDEYIEYLERQLYQFEYLGPEYTTPNPDYTGYFGNNPGANVNFTLEDPDNPGQFKRTDFDWWDEGTQNSLILDNNLSITGASEKVSYLLSIGLTDQKGIIKNDNFLRKNLRLNLEADVNNWWKVGMQTFGSFINQDGDEPALAELRSFSPLLTPYDEDGNLVRNPSGTIELNPFLAYDTEDYERHNYFFANLYTEIDIPFIKGLTYRLNFGNNYRIDKQYGASIYGAGGVGDAGKFVRFYYDYTFDNILNFNRAFGMHDIGATILYGAIERKGEETDIYVSDFNRLSLGYNDLNLGSIPVANSGAYTESLNYQMLRVNYKFDNRYIITGTLRKDGFSGFAENQKTAFFPSGAVGWNISKEAFMKDVDWVYNLKLRASYGISGNQTSRYSSLARLTTRAAYVFGDGEGPAFGQELTSLPNPNLRWEKTAGLNVGVDFSLFTNRIEGTLDVYKNVTNDLLFAVRVPYLTGFDQIQTNLGEVQNKGVELSLTGNVISVSDFSWKATVNFSKNKNEIISLTGKDEDGDGVEDDLIQNGLFIGKSINAIYDYEVNGIYQIGEENVPPGYSAGRYRIVDQNTDGSITQADDRTILGTRDPDFRASLLNTFKYKNFSLNIFINTIQGGKDSYIAPNDNALYRDANTLWLNNLSGIDYWSPQNPDGLNALAAGAPAIAGRRFENRSFVRLQDVSLRYSFDKSLLEKIGIGDFSIFVSGKNLATWTKWRGWDPEFQDTSDSNPNNHIYGVGMTRNGRPVLKAYSVGITLTF